MKDIVRLGLVMGFCSAAASAMAENSWTKETWDDTYAIPSDALSGMPTSGQNADAFTDFEMTGARPSTVSGGRVWTFAEPKDISSVQILTAGHVPAARFAFDGMY